MAINKNFVIKNGAEINTKLLVVDADSQRVGVGTTVAGYTLHVFGTNEQPGGIGASVVNVTGVTTTVLLNVSAAATFSNGPVFIGVGQSTGTPLQPLQVGSATTTKGIYVSGDVGIGETFPAAKLEVVPESTRIAGLFTGTTSDDMVRITQLGSGNALTIEDSSNPDSTPVIVDASGDTGIGTDKARAKLHVLPNVNGIAGLFSGSTSNDMVRITQMGEGNALVVEDVVADGTPFIVKATGDTGIGIGSDPIGAKLHVVPSTPGIGGMFTGATAGDMVRITQTGGGNALVVEDEGNPDSSPFTIKASGDTGIGTNSPGAKLHVTPTATAAAGIFSGTTSADMVRITQTGSGNALVVEDEANEDATSFVVSGVGSVGIGTNVPRYLLDVDGTKLASEGVAVGQTAVYIRGDVKIVGDLSCDDITFDQAVHTFLNVSGFGTITDLLVPETASINIGIITSIQGGNLSLAGITSFLKAPGISTLARVTGEDINLTGIATIARLNAPGISTIGFLQNTTLNVTGFSTFGGSSATLLNVSGVTTVGGGFEANQGINAARLNVTGITTLGFATAAALKVSGISTLGDTTAASAVVTGISTFSDNVSIGDSIFHTGDTDTSIRFPAADTFTVETAGAERFRIRSDGNVGVNDSEPTVPFNVKAGGGSFAGQNTHVKIEDTTSLAANVGGLLALEGIFNSSGDPAAYGMIHGGKENATDGNYAGYLRLFTRANGSLPAERVRIDSAGLVGIGTANPSTKLHLSSGSATQLTISNISDSMSDGATMGTIDFTAGSSNTINARVGGLVEGTSEAGGDLVFETRADGGSLGERLRVTSSGRVGIGSDAPISPLNILTSDDSVIVLKSTDANAYISFNDSDSSSDFANRVGTVSDGLYFNTGGGGERLRITSAGLVGIGTATPRDSSTLDVDGGGRFNGDVSLSGSTGAGSTVLFDQSDNSLKFVDSAKAKFGSGGDLEVYHNGSDSFITDNSRHLIVRADGSGDLYLQSDNQVLLTDIGGNETFIECNDNSDVKLFYDNSIRVTTTSDGADFSGTGSIKIPVGTTAQRNASPVAGDFRYNSTLGQFEGYTDSWGEIGGSGGVSETDTSVSTVNPTGVGSFATASFRSAAVIAQIDQTGSGFQVGRYLMIHDGTNVTVVEESAVATGDMLGSFDGAIVGSNAEFRVTMASAGIATVTTKIDTVTV